jgi:hypothetical protein
VQCNGDFAPIFQVCDFTPPFHKQSLRLPLFLTPFGDERLKK